MSLASIFHSLTPRLCMNTIDVCMPSAWQGTELRCPVCGRLIAYRYPLHHKWQIVVCTRYQPWEQQITESGIIEQPEEASVDLSDVITKLHAPDPLYDSIECVSDEWDDEPPDEQVEQVEQEDQENP